MKIEKVKVGGKNYDVSFTWRTMMIYEDVTGRNISNDMNDMSKMSFISRMFAAGLVTVEQYQKKDLIGFEGALDLLQDLSDKEYQPFISNILKWFLLSLPKSEDVNNKAVNKEKKS